MQEKSSGGVQIIPIVKALSIFNKERKILYWFLCVNLGRQKYDTGFEISFPENSDAEIFVAGAKLENGKVLTAGGRVLGVTAVAKTLSDAIDKAYAAVKTVSFKNAFYRKDIGQKALNLMK